MESLEQKCAVCFVSLEKKSKKEKVRRKNRWFCIKHKASDAKDYSHSEGESSEKVTIAFKSPAVKTHRRCIFDCKESLDSKSLLYLNKNLRSAVFFEHKFIIREGSRCCSHHLTDGAFDPEFLSNFIQNCSESSTFSASEIEELLLAVCKNHSTTVQSSESAEGFFSNLSEHHLKVWTGLNRLEFETLCEFIPKKDDILLGIYLMHLYAGLSQEQIAAILNISQPTVSRKISECRRHLNDNFVSVYLGVFLREQIRAEQSKISRVINCVSEGDDIVITIWDGTYLFLNKSLNFRFQRKTFGGQKKRNYVKPMIVITTNGLIIDVFGPDELYAGNVSDADILKRILNTEFFKNFFKPGDIFILDRGFERVKEDLEALGFKVSIPCLKKGNSQLSTLEANQSRLCTKQRWAIEVVNSSIKRFKHLSSVVPSQEYPHLYTDIRIAAAIHNKFFKRLYSDDDDPSVATRMLQNLNRENLLQKVVEKESLVRKYKNFQKISEADYQEFPVWDSKDFKPFCGTYQLSLARSYIGDHISSGNYEFQLCKESFQPNFSSYGITAEKPIFLKCKLISRHKSNKVYSIFILIDSTKRPLESIIESYCTCKNGARTIGSCAHVVAIIWYFGCGRHIQDFGGPSDFLNKCFPLGKLTTEETEDEESDEDA